MNYSPIIKTKDFCPNPIPINKIPEFADGSSYPDVIGTRLHTEFWEEQIYYCLNGYNTGGIHIPGRYYWYLNFCYISSIGRGFHHPDYVDADLEYFKLIDEIKKAKKGLISLKARRRGLSEKWGKGICCYGLRFTPEKYRAGITAGLKDHSEGLFSKVKELNGLLPVELQLGHIIDNSSDIEYGWQDATTGSKRGSLNSVTCQTMNNNPNVLKGNFFNDLAWEESGEFPNLIPGYGATKDCFAVGNEMAGTPYVYGTGGNISSGSAGFAEMWYKPENYGLVRFELYAQRLMIGFFIGSKDSTGKLNEDCPNLLKKYPGKTRAELLGCEDVAASLEYIAAKKIELSKSIDKQPYYDFLQNMPTNQNEAFLKFSGNNFHPESLASQFAVVSSLETPKYGKYDLEFKRNENGALVVPLEIEKIVELPDETPDDQAILILKDCIPTLGKFKNVDCAGIDSYDQDITLTSKSLGAMTVYRRKNNFLNRSETPIVLIRQRPARKEVFYLNCLKVSVLCNLERSTLIDVRNPLIIKFFKQNHGARFLAKRPQSIESQHSEQVHEFGVSINVSSKPLMIGALQTWILDNSTNMWFPQHIVEAQDYDVKQRDSDWDALDSLGIALIQDMEMGSKKMIAIVNSTEVVENYGDELVYRDGVLVSGNAGEGSKMSKSLVYANGEIISDHLTLWMMSQGE